MNKRKIKISNLWSSLAELKRVPAYQRFLKSRHVSLGRSLTARLLKRLPISDKANYINRSRTEDLYLGGKLPPMIYASSGSSGQPTFWFRGDEQEVAGGLIHREILEKIFRLRKNERTLVVICFSMGVWVAGNYTLACFRQLARDGYNLSIIAPGVEREDIFNALKILAPKFDNLILAGYPPFIMDIISEAEDRGLALNNRKVNILTAGDKFSEEWRDDLLALLPHADPYSTLVGVYGSADAGAMGHETPLTIFLRRQALANKEFYRALFGDAPSHNLPGLVQYHPSQVFFEEVNGELVLTTNAGAPLVRYNIHDTGRIISPKQLHELLERFNLLSAAEAHGLSAWPLPCLVLKGRTDVAVTFYALNIYPENIQMAIDQRQMAKYLTGNFSAYNKTINRSRTQKLFIELELVPGQLPTPELVTLVTNTVTERLRFLNIEYRKLCSAIGKKALPHVLLVPHGKLSANGHSSHFSQLVYLKGKKPKMVLT